MLITLPMFFAGKLGLKFSINDTFCGKTMTYFQIMTPFHVESRKQFLIKNSFLFYNIRTTRDNFMDFPSQRGSNNTLILANLNAGASPKEGRQPPHTWCQTVIHILAIFIILLKQSTQGRQPGYYDPVDTIHPWENR